MSRIAEAYVQIVPSMTGVKQALEKEFGDLVNKSTEAPAQSFGSKLSEGLSSVGRKAGLIVGGVAALGLGAALTTGMQRLTAIDDATAKLTGLGHSAGSVEQIMDDALASVKGTAFGLGDAAGVAASAVAAGIQPGEDLERTLKAVADASTIAGTDMGSMGAIFNKVAASNKVQMDVINQLQDAGVPALALLAEQMGVTAEEAAAMASAGEINFETFQAAMEAGMGGAALESGNTFSGAMDNVMASLGRMGAGLLEGVFPDMKNGLSSLMDAMAPLEDAAKGVGEGIKVAFDWISQNWRWIEPFTIALGLVTVGLIAMNVVMWAIALNPLTIKIGLIIAAVGLLIGAVILLVKNWDEVVTWLGTVWDGFVGWLTDGLNAVGSFFTDVWTNISTFFSDVWDGIVQTATDAWNGVVAFFQTGLQAVVTLFLNWTLLGQIIKNWDNIMQFFQNGWKALTNFFTGALNGLVNGWTTAFTGIGNFVRDTFNNMVNFVKTPINAIIGLINGAIDAVNGLNIDIPDWVPGVGGSTLGFNIPRIPMLADGGTITRAGKVLVGEEGPEILDLPRGAQVVPLERAGAGGGVTYHVTNPDPAVVVEMLMQRMNGRLAIG